MSNKREFLKGVLLGMLTLVAGKLGATGKDPYPEGHTNACKYPNRMNLVFKGIPLTRYHEYIPVTGGYFVHPWHEAPARCRLISNSGTKYTWEPNSFGQWGWKKEVVS